ncbi:HEAT repeat-containing protein 6 [Phytophthora boehmeriae]|uniref:HEAT repeat-containing protein 6 n=1 Tax=Phytophthora boehmeriae TaxID=109152 RepID=A0A8T1W7T4_9STRA|nr:HEAT repeat-containing protein 6 [Phytophthora boehmeriae]
MAVFDGYLEDFESAREEALKAVDEYAQCTNAGLREELVMTARNNVGEVERYLRILENEVKNGSSTADKRRMAEQVRQRRTQFTNLKSSLEKEILVGQARAGATVELSKDATTKEQMERCADRIDRTGRHLDEAQRTIAHTETIAENVANNLLQQRNQLEHTTVNVTQAQEDTEDAKKHIRTMMWKAFTSRILLVFVMLGLAAAIVVISYYKWYPKNKKDPLGVLHNSTSSANGSTTGS